MWAQGAAPLNSSLSHTASDAPAPYLANHDPLQQVNHDQLLLLLQEKDAEARIYKEKYLQAMRTSPETWPVQETAMRNVPEGDESLENGRPQIDDSLEGGRQRIDESLGEAGSQQISAESIASSSVPAPQPVMVRPDIRMILHDTVGRRVEQTPPESVPWEISGGALGHDAWSSPMMVWSDSHVIDTQTMDPREERKIFLQTVSDYQSQTKEQGEKLKQIRAQNYTLLLQLQAAKMEAERMKRGHDWYKAERGEKQRLTDEVKKKDDTIRKLTEELQQLKNQQTPIRAGVKRGRFFMSRASTLECVTCGKVFSSQDEARTSVCAHHPKPACGLPNKMVAELHEAFPDGKLKHRYWPCCKAIANCTPPPCYRGPHVLTVV
ncbi:uncharacterized protein [Littorina saxatilis]|uniref:Uncharacterized protein n=1 Tax=Littorina saxatilis TaxID=31220 RepID=A0AAN9BCJ1_9CAEN